MLVRRGLDDLRVELGVPAEFPAHVIAEAEAAAAGAPDGERSDATDIPFVTIDPEGSKDLDQAVHIERRDGGFRVRYAIADVAAWVSPGGAIDDEARDRVETLYAPDGRTPLHPPLLSEGVASLLPDQVTPALLWTIDLDAEGAPVDVDVRRASVQSRAQLTYVGAQAALDDGTADETLQLLREVGILREAAERARGGITLPTPEQVVEQGADGVWTLGSRATLPVEEWNAQISLLTGMCAARLMLDGRIGILRTLPDADPRDVERLRLSAHALGVPWPAGRDPGRRHPRPRRGEPGARGPAHRRDLAAARRRLRGVRRRGAERSPCTPRSPRPTPTRPRRCAGWWTGSSARRASPCAPTARSRTGSATRCRSCPDSWRRGTSTPPSSSAAAWTWSRRRC